MTALIQRHVLVDTAEYFSCLDEFEVAGEQMLLMHIDVPHLRFTPSAFKHMLRAWATFRNCTEAPLFAIEPSPDDAKWERFVSSFGFKFSSRVDCPDGLSRRVFISHKDEPKDYHSRKLAADPVGGTDRLHH